jgi:tagatose-1,6-bisphosphate aldolase
MVACQAGASGIAVGRAVWQEAVALEGSARIDFLQSTARERLARLTEVCNQNARPIQSFYTTDTPFDWYKTY